MYELRIENRNAWITGGSRGIGKAIGIALAKAGCNVAISYKSNQAAAEDVVSEIEACGVKGVAVELDVTDAENVLRAYETIKGDLGPIGILVNSAGVIADNLFMLLPENDWHSVLDINLMGTVRTTNIVLKDMMGERWGRIINLSSVAATRGGRGQANYAASKGAIEAMSRSLAAEVGRRGITVNCIAPGVIETDMTQEVIKLAKDEILNRQIIKRFGSPEEIAAWAVMLASDYSGFITGQVIHVDGGLKMA